MNIDLGWLGKVTLEEWEPWAPSGEGFVITHDGYTESGIRVNVIVDERPWRTYPTCWNNAILIKVDIK